MHLLIGNAQVWSLSIMQKKYPCVQLYPLSSNIHKPKILEVSEPCTDPNMKEYKRGKKYNVSPFSSNTLKSTSNIPDFRAQNHPMGLQHWISQTARIPAQSSRHWKQANHTEFQNRNTHDGQIYGEAIIILSMPSRKVWSLNERSQKTVQYVTLEMMGNWIEEATESRWPLTFNFLRWYCGHSGRLVIWCDGKTAPLTDR